MSRLSFSNYDLARARRYARIRRTGFLAGMTTSLLWEAGLVATGYSAKLRNRIGGGIAQNELATPPISVRYRCRAGWLAFQSDT